jgi:hypothetical protein
MADQPSWVAVAVACVGVLGTLGGAVLGYQSGAMSVNKDYVQIAMNNLNNDKSTPELREWSVEILNKLSPVPMNSSLIQKLSMAVGPLEARTNRQGNDINPYGLAADNPQMCAQMCAQNDKCDAMTFIESTHSCWLKHGVPPSSPNPDMISAVKARKS